MVTIREVTLLDAISLSLLGRVTYIQSHDIYFDQKQDLIAYCDAEYSVAKTRRQIQDPNTQYLLALVDELPVGFAKLKFNEHSSHLNLSNTCQVEKIYVLNDFTSKKIGHTLLNAIMTEATNRKCEAVWLSTYIKNVKAINFYKKNGYEQIGSDDFVVNDINYEQIALGKKI